VWILRPQLSHAHEAISTRECAGGVEPVLKPVVAVVGDVVDIGPEAVTVNGQRLPSVRPPAWTVSGARCHTLGESGT